MERVEAELFTDGGNNAVVRLPPRRFPGVLIQGDSLSVIRSEVAEVLEACDQGDLAGARETAGLLLADLDEVLGDTPPRWTPTRSRGRTDRKALVFESWIAVL
ncbi:hypothetical protein ABT076_07185 [Streptomyces sp. NPDC002131]|uniref:DUF6959 family protein n=1 Tax=Streptomyces sp. NPDC002131 TaxID=3154535 RepID=UPI003316DBF2